ncbi:MAG: response regulator [Flaviaesturariibacter sp.]|nr:response regulator [Flaviaesturariibacter sp.]
MKNIFLAEDDADDRNFFEDALQQVTIPTHLTLANNGLELMNNLKTVTEPPPPHIVFLDLNMPLKDGFQCLEEIRNTPKIKGIPVVIFSTTASEDAVNKTYELGANYYICKPRSFDLLVKAIQTVLSLEMWQEPQPRKEKFVLSIT